MIAIPFAFVNAHAAEYVCCDCTTITSIPYTISSSGAYCLSSDLSTSSSTGNAVTINADDVTIYMNGHELKNTAGSGTSAVGISASQRNNVRIYNGTIRGFFTGINLYSPGDYSTYRYHVVDGIYAAGNTHIAINVEGAGSRITNNTVTDTGGSTVNFQAWGIILKGKSPKISGNTVINTESTYSTVDTYPLFVAYGVGAVVEDNNVSNDTLVSKTHGIFMGVQSKDIMVLNNTSSRMTHGFYFVGDSSGTSGKYGGNTTTGCTTSYQIDTGSTMVDIGNNN